MSWRITFPYADGTTMDLYRLKFVASGTTPRQLEGRVAVSVTQDRTGQTWGGQVVHLGAVAHGGVRTWTALFDLQGLQHQAGDTFTISLYHENTQGVWILHPPQRTRIRFNLRREVDPQGGMKLEFYHTIIYPGPGATLSATAVSAYGMVAPGETVAADGGTLDYNNEVSDGGGTQPSGFWWVTFNSFAPPTTTPRNTLLTVTLAIGTTAPQTRWFNLTT
jgi:hypothetical protein